MSLIPRCIFFLTSNVFEIGMHLIISGILVLCHSLSAFYIIQWYIKSGTVLQLIAGILDSVNYSNAVEIFREFLRPEVRFYLNTIFSKFYS